MEENIDLFNQNNFHVEIDDFGTGYSSIGSLYTHQVDGIKIDKSLIDNVHTEKGLKLFEHSVAMCKAMGFEVIAEGVETEEQMQQAISKNDVDYVQGWYYARALPMNDARQFALSFGQKHFLKDDETGATKPSDKFYPELS